MYFNTVKDPFSSSTFRTQTVKYIGPGDSAVTAGQQKLIFIITILIVYRAKIFFCLR